MTTSRGPRDGANPVLDYLDARQKLWADAFTWQVQIGQALVLASSAQAFSDIGPLDLIRAQAVEAAARLIDAIGEIDRCIAAGEA